MGYKKRDVNDSSVQVIKIRRGIPHPNYSWSKKEFDIGLIELEHDIKFSEKVKPICLQVGDFPEEMGNLLGHECDRNGKCVLEREKYFSAFSNFSPN